MARLNFEQEEREMALVKLMNNVPAEDPAAKGQEVRRTGKYAYIDTKHEGIKEVVSGQGGFLVFLDYGRKQKLNKKTGQLECKQEKSLKRVDTLKEARALRRQAEEIRLGAAEKAPSKVFFDQMVEDYKQSAEWRDSTQSAKDHHENYFRHLCDYFVNIQPKDITKLDVENYFYWQLERGKRPTAKKNKDGSVSKKEGISVNTLGKHKCALKKLWNYMVDSKKYGVTENIVPPARLPKVEISIDGKKKKVSKIAYHPRSLTLEELNYTLNDALQHEFDRSVAVMIALASIGSLRHSETLGLKLGKFLHDGHMAVTDAALNEGGFDREYYEGNDSLMLIDTAVMRIGSENVEKLPKGDKVRVAAVPGCLKEIVGYAMEQRKELYSLHGKEMDGREHVYLPLVNIIDNRPLNSQKMGRKWNEYQERRNQRMIKAGLEPIPLVRYHDLRHTHGNLLKEHVLQWQISYNMGHVVVVPEMDNTTTRVYWNDRQPNRGGIIEYFDSHIKIDWDKALRNPVNREGSVLKVNGSGQLVVSSAEMERRKAQGKKFIFKEEELEELFLKQEADMGMEVDGKVENLKIVMSSL